MEINAPFCVVQGLSVGLMSLLGIYQIYHYLQLKDRNLLYYITYLFGGIGLWVVDLKYSPDWLINGGNEQFYFSLLFLMSMEFFHLQFGLRKYLSRRLFFYGIIQTLLILFTGIQFGIYGCFVLVLMSHIMVLVLSQNYQQDQLFFWSQLVFLIGIVLSLLSRGSFISDHWLLWNAALFGTALEALVSFIGVKLLVDRKWRGSDQLKNTMVKKELLPFVLEKVKVNVANNQSPEAVSGLNQISMLLRNELESEDEVNTPLSRQLRFIEAYTNIEIQKGKIDRFDIRNIQDFESGDIYIPSMLLRTLLEAIINSCEEVRLNGVIGEFEVVDLDPFSCRIKISGGIGDLKSNQMQRLGVLIDQRIKSMNRCLPIVYEIDQKVTDKKNEVILQTTLTE